jgi:uncharacterized membrane protein HdeD (DUF308 family)
VAAVAGTLIERRRRGWDLTLGAVVVLAGLSILAHVAIAAEVSVHFLGWFALIGGIATLTGATLRTGQGRLWTTALGGGLLTVLGLMLLRYPTAAAVALTLIAGSLFLTGGVVRLLAAAASPIDRGVLIFSGAVSGILGLIILSNVWTATLVQLGLLLGVQTLMEGFSLLLFSRLHVHRMGPGTRRQSVAG